ncbi:pantothenate kinase [Petrotoga mexicana DSM 14811]|uniref:Type III pantothenate kinase n=1 Tax=Petrotoga mexicana DSM 14811 TaxID=1122954 RepID=A0A2K1P573_9BACT|nr:type III pantothenate kinase [Petrotoga mexicana]PNR97857.1 pantothenate kinase [Petrotoga mexicana DSM 14811]
MELLFDVGNSYTMAGIHEDGKFLTWRIGPSSFESEDGLFVVISNLLNRANVDLKRITLAGISSVVPNVNFILEQMLKKYFNVETIFVTTKNKINNIGYLVDYPNEIGADRICNVIACKEEYGDHVIALDFGTAITVDVLEGGNFVGGAIIPGFKTAISALFSRTAQLPKVEIKVPEYHLGKNTVDNIQIGVIKTTLYGIERLIHEIKRERNKDFVVVATGGDMSFLSSKVSIFKHYDPYLTLKGILYYSREIKKLR